MNATSHFYRSVRCDISPEFTRFCTLRTNRSYLFGLRSARSLRAFRRSLGVREGGAVGGRRFHLRFMADSSFGF